MHELCGIVGFNYKLDLNDQIIKMNKNLNNKFKFKKKKPDGFCAIGLFNLQKIILFFLLNNPPDRTR